MYWNDYIWFITAMLFCTLFSAIASGKVHSAFSKYSKVRCRSGKTGYDTTMTREEALSIFPKALTATARWHP